MYQMKDFKETLPAGQYFIGDVAIVAPEIFENKVYCNECETGTYEAFGDKFVIINLDFTDGMYVDQNKKPYCCQSGTIGVILKKHCSDLMEKVPDLGTIFTSKSNVQISVVSGVVRFAYDNENVQIDTQTQGFEEVYGGDEEDYSGMLFDFAEDEEEHEGESQEK